MEEALPAKKALDLSRSKPPINRKTSAVQAISTSEHKSRRLVPILSKKTAKKKESRCSSSTKGKSPLRQEKLKCRKKTSQHAFLKKNLFQLGEGISNATDSALEEALEGGGLVAQKRAPKGGLDAVRRGEALSQFRRRNVGNAGPHAGEEVAHIRGAGTEQERGRKKVTRARTTKRRGIHPMWAHASRAVRNTQTEIELKNGEGTSDCRREKGDANGSMKKKKKGREESRQESAEHLLTLYIAGKEDKDRGPLSIEKKNWRSFSERNRFSTTHPRGEKKRSNTNSLLGGGIANLGRRCLKKTPTPCGLARGSIFKLLQEARGVLPGSHLPGSALKGGLSHLEESG